MRRTLLIAAMLVAACSSLTTEPLLTSPALSLEDAAPASGQTARRVARIAFHQEPIQVDIPATGSVGAPITVGVTTYSGGCIADDTIVARIIERQADVVPFQRVYNPGTNGACTADFRVTRRQAAVVFAAAGQATVRVIGRAVPGDSLVQVVRTVLIR